MEERERIYKDGWDLISVQNHVINEIKEVISDGKEQDRVVDIMSDLLSPVDEVSWFFYESHSNDDNMNCEAIQKEIDAVTKCHTIYDSSWLNNIPDSGYNCIEVMLGEWNEETDTRDYYVVLSLNGSWLASALSEYFKFTEHRSTYDDA